MYICVCIYIVIVKFSIKSDLQYNNNPSINDINLSIFIDTLEILNYI